MLLKELKSKRKLARNLTSLSQVVNTQTSSNLRPSGPVEIPWWQTSRITRHNEPERVTEIPRDDLYLCSRPFLLTGRIFGIIPIEGLWGPDLRNVRFRLFSFATLLSVFELFTGTILTAISALQLLKMFFGVHTKKASRSIILDSRGPIVIAASNLIHFVLIRNAGKFVRLLHMWRAASASLVLTAEKTGLFNAVKLLAFGNFLLGVIHVYVIQLSAVVALDHELEQGAGKTNMSFLEYYYERSHWSEMIPYNPLAVLFVLGTRMVAIMSWHFSEGLILLLAKLLALKFQTLYEQARLRISPPKNISNTMTMFRKTSIEVIWRENLWVDLRKDHLICLRLLHETENIISPLVFLAYAVNIYLTCMQILQGITPAAHKNNYTHAILSFLTLTFLLTRLILMSLIMAGINENAHRIIKCVQKCPNHFYSSELERLERMLSNNTIGISGLGCFVVTKAFLLVVGSVIFTFQVVLMQAPVDAGDPKPNLTASL